MTRFKELKRIEAAISHKNIEELKWAESMCKDRLASASMKEHKKHWNTLLKKIENALDEE